MPQYREPDGFPDFDGEDYDRSRVIYIERPVKDGKLATTLDAVIIAILLGLSAFVWNFTTTIESRLARAEVRLDYLDRAGSR